LSDQGRFQRAWNDLVDGARRWRLWSTFAWEDVRQTYRRSVIGVMWVSLSFAIFAIAKIFIFGAMMGRQDAEYFGAYLLIGFFSWQFMAQTVNSAPTTFSGAENWIRNDPIPFSVFVYQAIFRSTFDLVLTGIVVLGSLFYFGYGASAYSLMVIPAVVIYIINAGWVLVLLGVVCTRYRDITHLVHAAMRVLFFLTPIFWFPSQFGEVAMRILWWNPFAHFIWILRTPVIDQQIPVDSWIFVGVLTVAGWVAAFLSFALFHRRIVFWF
jgi:ABC-type polysaccharide/polyol phosphate export permease